MKTSYKFLILSAVVSLLGLTSNASAAVVAYDNFDYYAVDLDTQSGGSPGWTSAWTATSGVDSIVSNKVELVGDDDNAAFRSFTTQTGPKLFFSATVKFDGVLDGPPNPDFFSIWLDNGLGLAPHASPNIGIRANAGGVNVPFFDYFLRIDPTFPKFSTTQAVPGNTVQLVGLLEKVGTTYRKLSLWVNTTPGSYASLTPDVTHTFTSGFTNINRIGFRTANLDGGDKVTVDEVFLGTLASDVNIIPEPATMAIWGSMGLLGLVAGFRRRNKKN
jgi:hypothetical protein